MPVAMDGDILGILDARLSGGAWRIDAMELRRLADPERLRAGIRRIAALAGASRILAGPRLERRLGRLLAGPLDR